MSVIDSLDSHTGGPARYRVAGRQRLSGSLTMQGAKNAVLPMIAGALLAESGSTTLTNVPPINDVFVQMALAEAVGAKVSYDRATETLSIDASSVANETLDSRLTTRSRASVLFLPAVLHRLKRVRLEGVGGCSLGVRRLDFHHNGFKRLGAHINGEHDHLLIEAEALRGNLVYLDMPSQTSTENLMMAGALAIGTTVIENAASEPEVVDFAHFLNSMGARIYGAGTPTIAIQGVPRLRAVEYRVMPDRLEIGPFMVAAGITGGNVMLRQVDITQVRLLAAKLEQMGVTITALGTDVRVQGPSRPKAVNAITWPYPGVSTDFLPSLMTFAALGEGTSYLRETVFENRFTQVPGLNCLGARIASEGNLATIRGVAAFRGCTVTAPDLRAGMAFLLAGLAAEGETIVDNAYQIERGHARLEQRFAELGATVRREAA